MSTFADVTFSHLHPTLAKDIVENLQKHPTPEEQIMFLRGTVLPLITGLQAKYLIEALKMSILASSTALPADKRTSDNLANLLFAFLDKISEDLNKDSENNSTSEPDATAGQE